MEKINTFGRKVGVSLVLVCAAIVGAASPSFATPSTETQVTTMATTAFAQALPILLAVAGAAVGLAVAFFGARLVLKSIKRGGGI